LAKDSDQEEIRTCQQHLESFAENGYRTLCFSTRTIPEDFYNQWSRTHHEASVSLENRNEKMAESAEQIEKELRLVGVTAIEDKLQDVSS
jgi:magnesium-transporting ATPase (P-type)